MELKTLQRCFRISGFVIMKEKIMQMKETSSNKKDILVFIMKILALVLFTDVFILRLLPKGIAFIAKQMGTELLSSDLLTKYCMGIGVRAFGILVIVLIMLKSNMLKTFTYKLKLKAVLISWMFIIYIIANIEIGDFSHTNVLTVVCMMVEAMTIGIFEEFVFRGTMFPMFLKMMGQKRNGVLLAVLSSSIVFGLFHLSNLLTGASVAGTLTQVVYSSIIGIAFSALLLRTNMNLIWCSILHGLFDMASGFGDFVNVAEESKEAASQTVSMLPYLLNLALFIPLLIYGLFIIRRKKISGYDIVSNKPIFNEIKKKPQDNHAI